MSGEPRSAQRYLPCFLSNQRSLPWAARTCPGPVHRDAQVNARHSDPQHGGLSARPCSSHATRPSVRLELYSNSVGIVHIILILFVVVSLANRERQLELLIASEVRVAY